jgi:hypothetical protein
LAKHEYPLVPNDRLSLISLTGHDYPKLRGTFAKVWDRLANNLRSQLLQGWHKRANQHHLYPRIPWIVAVPAWPSRTPDEFGLVHPSGVEVRFIAPLIELMPEDLAIGVVARELGYAYAFLAGPVKYGPMWAVQPRSVWTAELQPIVQAFEESVGCRDLTAKLVDWAQTPAAVALSEELEKDAFWLNHTVSQDAGFIYM